MFQKKNKHNKMEEEKVYGLPAELGRIRKINSAKQWKGSQDGRSLECGPGLAAGAAVQCVQASRAQPSPRAPRVYRVTPERKATL
jgi:hypothetical protein